VKSAKEWANEVVTVPEDRTGEWWVYLEDDRDHVAFIAPWGEDDGQEIASKARGVIERLAVRIQRDAVDQDTLRELDALADEMDRQCEYGIDNPGREYEKAIRLIRRLTKP
jgi:DNA-binding GntR family transcriptional regulator